MPAKDIFHNAVKQALIKDGWVITDDPLVIKLQDSDINLFVDLGAERLIAAEKANEKIAVEIKSFIGTSFMTDFHEALGQFLNYRVALKDRDPGRHIYLAIPLDIYDAFFSRRFVQLVHQEYNLAEIIFDPKQEVICSWIK
ncbi:MAG: XisH family protein [Desulfamplus sp.]|nr:XisH family protein [Desulfamplus sp.]